MLGAPQNITATATDPDGNTSELGSFGLDLLVDTDRDNEITAADETGKDAWAASSGAIVLDNSNEANQTIRPAFTNPDGTQTPAGTMTAPDNWPGGVFGGAYQPPNNSVFSLEEIENEISPLWLNQLNASPLPPNLAVTLWVSKPTDGSEPTYFRDIPADQLVRIFMPSDDESDSYPGDIVLSQGDQGIIYPDIQNNAAQTDLGISSVSFVRNPDAARPAELLDFRGTARSISGSRASFQVAGECQCQRHVRNWRAGPGKRSGTCEGFTVRAFGQYPTRGGRNG